MIHTKFGFPKLIITPSAAVASFQPIIGGSNISYSTTSLSPCYCDV